jgi:hypothetical protein
MRNLLNEEIDRLKKELNVSLNTELVKTNKELNEKVEKLNKSLQELKIHTVNEDLVKKIMYIQQFVSEVQK